LSFLHLILFTSLSPPFPFTLLAGPFIQSIQDEDVKPSKSSSKSKPAASPPKRAPPKVTGHVVGSKVLRGKTRGADRDNDIDESAQHRLKEHQRELHQQRQERGLERFAEDGDKGNGDGGKKSVKKFESYKREDQLPREVARRRIYVDDAKQTIILPINGFPAPFHINTIKNVSKNEEGEYTYLRINFQSPGQIAGKKEDTVRSLSYLPLLPTPFLPQTHRILPT
jgi:nucleosome binding factor SPN SPT16 subunit